MNALLKYTQHQFALLQLMSCSQCVGLNCCVKGFQMWHWFSQFKSMLLLLSSRLWIGVQGKPSCAGWLQCFVRATCELSCKHCAWCQCMAVLQQLTLAVALLSYTFATKICNDPRQYRFRPLVNHSCVGRAVCDLLGQQANCPTAGSEALSPGG